MYKKKNDEVGVMKKETKIVVAIAICITIVFGVMAFIFGGGEEPVRFAFEQDITVQDGVADPAAFTRALAILKEGDYQIHIDWNCDADGLITGARLLGAEDNTLFWLTGNSVNADMAEMHLQRGGYILEFYNLTRAEDFKAFVATSSGGMNDGSFAYDAEGNTSELEDFTFAKSGSFHNSYSCQIKESGTYEHIRTIALVVGIIIGLSGAVLILIFTKKDKKLEAEYDEMQQMIRGRAYFVGFWTAIIYFVAVAFCDIIGVQFPAQDNVVAFIGIFISIFVIAVYCIWADAYFGMNEDRKAIYKAYIILGVSNLLFGIMNICSGDVVVDGMLTYRCLNLLCTIMFAVIGILIWVRRKKAAGEEE